MAEAYEAPTISIEMSMGRHRDGALAESVKGIARHLRQHVVKDQVELTRMRARIRPGDERPEEIDLLEDILSVKNELSLRDNDPDANYALKLRGGSGCLNRFSASISGASAGVRLPSGVAAG
jgi:hypothetical protein